MAEAAKSFYADHFCCPVCLEVLKDPVTIPCGHNYCMGCISNVWADVDQNGVYSCPQCREAFTSKPALNKNILVAEMIEKLKITSDQTTPEKHYSSEVVNLECDSCTGTKNPAVKFCLQCLASFCEFHVQPHYKSPAFMKHTLVQASSQMQKNICQHHVRLLDIYCHDDHQCICYMCMLDSHKDHKTSSVESERIQNQKTLEGTKTQLQQMIDQREEGLQELSRAVTSFKSFTQAAEDDTERILTELMSFMKERFSKVKELIKTHERRELSRADELRFQINQELTDLKTNTAGIEELLATSDDIDFMRKYNLLQAFPTYKDLPSITCHPRESSGTISLSALKEHMEVVCQQEVARISRKVKNVFVVPLPEPKTREDFLQYFCDLSVDLNTIYNEVYLSEENRKMTQITKTLPYPDHPERFDGFSNVLCKEALLGRCYWEVEYSGNDWSIAVAYKNIKRKGTSDECRFGFNPQSWRLSLGSSQGFYFMHDQSKIQIPQPDSKIIGVYLDHNAGTLSYYSVSHTMTLLHKVQTMFTEPVHAGFGIGRESDITILIKENE